MPRQRKARKPRAAPARPKRVLRPRAVAADEELAGLLNLGPQSARWLVEAGIRSRADIERLGVIQVCRRVRATGRPVSVLLAYALEGALMGCRWNEIPFPFKQALRAEFAAWRAADARGR